MRRTTHQWLLASAAAAGLAFAGSCLADNNSQDTQSETSNPSRITQGSHDASNAANPSNPSQSTSLTGQVLAYREVEVDGAQHFRARVKEPDGQVQSVDLGPAEQNGSLIQSIEQGDTLRVQGRVQKVDGKSVFVASQAAVGGKNYTIRGTGQSAPNQPSPSERKPDQAANTEQNPRSGSNANQQQDQRQNPQSIVWLDQRLIFYNEGDLNRHFILAKEALNVNDARRAAGELHAAADKLELYATAAKGRGEASELLNRSRQDLGQLASQISQKSEQKAEDASLAERIDEAAARAHLGMASFYDARLASAPSGRDPVETGYDLQAAAIHANQALLWSDENAPAHSMRTLHQAARAADALIAGNTKQAGNTSELAQNLSRQIDAINQQLGESRQAQPAGAKQGAEQNANSPRKSD